MDIVVLVLITLAILIIVYACVISNHTTYCYVYGHKDWKRWNKFIKNANKFNYKYVCDDIKETYIMKDENDNILYYAFIWDNDNLCSVHAKNGECILSPFNTYKSKQMVNVLKKRKLQNIVGTIL